jgi:MFS family permease
MSALTPLRYPAFRYLAAGRVVNMLGNAVAPIALAFAVLDLTGSVRDLGLVVGARSVTNVIFILFGGVLADRLPRQFVMVASCALAALSQAAAATLVLTGSASIPLLAILGAINGVVSAFAFPAASALIAQTVPDNLRRQANAINRLGINGAMIIGASLGGLLVAGVGPGWGLVGDAASFALSGVLFGLARVPPYREVAAASTNLLRELREGWTEFVGNTWVWVVVLAFGFFNMAEVGAISVLGPVTADETFGRTIWGFVLAAQTAGMVVGALIAMRLKVRRLLLLGVVSCLGPALLLAALGFTTHAVLLMVTGFVAGIGIEQFGIAWETSVQEHIPADKLARVYSYDALGSFVAIPIGQVAAGPLAEAVGVRTALLIAAGVIVLSVVGMLLSPSVRTLEHLPSTRQPADTTSPVPLAAA